MNLIASDWKDYELIDCGDGERLERWGTITMRRPDPQVLWPKDRDAPWDKADARYFRSSKGGGHWEGVDKLPNRWEIRWNDLKFIIHPTDFKHMGLFPEQAANWAWMRQAIADAGRPIKVLNLFAYTGGATVAAASAGAEVVHLDAAKGMVNWAKENLECSDLGKRTVRFLVDDVVKFVRREQRRGNVYDGIIMDPPSYGRGTQGETWKIEANLLPLLRECQKVVSDNPLFFLINAYSTGLSPRVLANLLGFIMHKHKGELDCGEVYLPVSRRELLLPCGVYGRWMAS